MVIGVDIGQARDPKAGEGHSQEILHNQSSQNLQFYKKKPEPGSIVFQKINSWDQNTGLTMCLHLSVIMTWDKFLDFSDPQFSVCKMGTMATSLLTLQHVVRLKVICIKVLCKVDMQLKHRHNFLTKGDD